MSLVCTALTSSLWAPALGGKPTPRGGKKKSIRSYFEVSEGIPGRTWWRSKAASGCPPLGSGASRDASRGRVGRRWLRCESFPLHSGSHWHRGRSYNSTGGTEALGHRGRYAESSLHCSLSWYRFLGLHCPGTPGMDQGRSRLPSLPWWWGYSTGALEASASPFRLPGLLGIRDVLCDKPLHYISSSHWKDAILLWHCTVGERHFLFRPVSDVSPQQAPQPAVNLVRGISRLPPPLLRKNSRSRGCPRVRNPAGAGHARPLPRCGPCSRGLCRGRSLPLLCVQAFHVSHDPFVFPTACALTFVFLKIFYFGFAATVQACGILK